MPPCSCETPGKKPGYVFEGDQRNIETVAEAYEARGLHGGIDIEHAGQKRGLIGHNPHGAPIEPGEANADVWRVMLLDFEKVAVIDNRMDYVANVVRLI